MSGAASITYTFGLYGGSFFWFEVKSQTGDAVLTFPLTFNQWKHVTGTLDGATGEMRLYFDGVLVTNQITNVRAGYSDPASQPAMAIGNTPYGGAFPFIGLVDELVLYSRALSPSEVQGLAQIPPTAPFISSQPASQTNTVGATSSFTVVAGGTVPLNYQNSSSRRSLRC